MVDKKLIQAIWETSITIDCLMEDINSITYEDLKYIKNQLIIAEYCVRIPKYKEEQWDIKEVEYNIYKYKMNSRGVKKEELTDGEVLDLVYDWVKKWDGNTNGKSTALLGLKQILQEHEE